MNTTNTRRWRRIPIHLAAAAAVVTGGAAIGGAVIANNDDGPPVDARPAHADHPAVTEATPTADQRERQRLQDALAAMPSYWPAAQAMRQELDELEDAARQRLQVALAAMPSYWPAAQAMRQELSELGGPTDRPARVDDSNDRPV